MTHITNGVNVINWCSVVICGNDFTVFSDFHANIFETDLLGFGVSTNGEKNGIEGILNLILTLLVSDDLSSLRIQLDTDGNGLLDELHSGFFHVVSDFVCDLLVKASEEDRSDHNGDIASDSVQESAAFQSYITSSDD